jgi:hypothetical protein
VVIVHHGPKHRTEEAAAETLGQMHRGACVGQSAGRTFDFGRRSVYQTIGVI